MWIVKLFSDEPIKYCKQAIDAVQLEKFTLTVTISTNANSGSRLYVSHLVDCENLPMISDFGVQIVKTLVFDKTSG